MGALSIWHWLIVLAVVLLLFGSRTLPDAARGLGRSMRIFKSEIKEMQNDDKGESSEEPQAITEAQPNAAQYAQPHPHPQQAPQQSAAQPQQAPQQSAAQPQQPYQQPAAQPQQPAPQHQQPQQFSDPTAPYHGDPGAPGR